MRFSKTKNMVYAAIFIAISIILTRFFVRMVYVGGIPGLRLSFGEIPILLAGLFLGPYYGAAVGALADLIGYPLAPLGPYFPGFTLSSAFIGFLPGLLGKLRKRDWTFGSLSLVIAPTIVISSILMNTFWIHMLYGAAVVVLLPPRIVANLIMIPIYVTISHLLLNKLKVYNRMQS